MMHETEAFEIEKYRHAVRLWTIVLEISVLMAQFPSKKIAKLSYDYRTLGLGYANLGALLMLQGIPYDSNEALAITGALTCNSAHAFLCNFCRNGNGAWSVPEIQRKRT